MAVQSEDVADLVLTASEGDTHPRDVTLDGRPKRVRTLSRKGLESAISEKTLQFGHLRSEVDSVIVAATKELSKTNRVGEALSRHREQITSSLHSLNQCASDLQELEANEAITATLAEVQVAAYDTISQLAAATASTAHSATSRHSRSIHSQTSKHSKASSRASTRSESSSTESNTSAKISAEVTTATLVARLKGQYMANEIQREIEATEEEERRKKRELQREIEATEEEQARKKRELQREIEATEEEQARKKKQRQRQLDELELRTQIAEQKAIIDVLESYEESSSFPILPHLNLVDYLPSGLLVPFKPASTSVSHESARQDVSVMANFSPHAGPDQQTTTADTTSTIPESTAAIPSAVLSSLADQLTVSSAVRDVVFVARVDGLSTEQTASSVVTTSLPRPVDGPSVKTLLDPTTLLDTAGAIHGSSTAVHTTAGAIHGSSTAVDTTSGAIHSSSTALDTTAGAIHGSSTAVDTTAGVIHGSSAAVHTTTGAINGSRHVVHPTASAGQPVTSTQPFWSAGERRPIDEPSTHSSSPRVDLLRPSQSGLGIATGADHFSSFGHQPLHENAYRPRFPSSSHAYALDPRLNERTNETERNGTERHGTEQNERTERHGTEQNGTYQNGTERNDTERDRTERNGTERNGTQRNGTERTERVERTERTD